MHTRVAPAAAAAARTTPRRIRQSFIEWLGRHGPHELMIDGANVALWGENYEGGGFRPEKIRRMHDAVAARHPGVKLLLVRWPREALRDGRDALLQAAAHA